MPWAETVATELLAKQAGPISSMWVWAQFGHGPKQGLATGVLNQDAGEETPSQAFGPKDTPPSLSATPCIVINCSRTSGAWQNS